MDWKNSDPREELCGMKRAVIIILRPSLRGYGHWEAGVGGVEMKHGWFISTSFENRPSVDKWDESWFWAIAPDFPGSR